MNTQHETLKAIAAKTIEREKRILSSHACPSSQALRKYPDRERGSDIDNIRPPFYRDTDRIIHSKSYSRYIDKTQVFSLIDNDHITHRVLHVQFVSKIARTIVRCLELNEDLVEAISLGHDLGHAPFGHDGEHILHELCQENDLGCFCHNAQSVRALMELERKGRGLNLSLQVLDGILAHNGELISRQYIPDYDKDWEQFEHEYSECFRTPNFSRCIRPMTLEGCVMRISDVVAYIGRDIEDAIELKLLHREEIPDSIRCVLGDTNSSIINTLVNDLIVHSINKKHLEFSDPVFQALNDLLLFNRESIYFNPLIKTEAAKIRNVMRTMYQCYMSDLADASRIRCCSII